MADDIGSYEVFNAAGNAIRFWPLRTARTLVEAAPPPAAPNPVQPGQPNVIVVANFGLVDVALPIPPQATLTRVNVANPNLPAHVAGRGVTRAELFANQNGNANVAQLTFAVDAGHAVNPFNGELRITITTTDSKGRPVDHRLDILLQVRPRQQEDGLFIAPALVPAHQSYTWIRARAVSQANAATNVGNARGVLRILRDNRTVRDFNREYDVSTNNAGRMRLQAAGLLGGAQDRTTVGVPLNLPIALDLTAASFERRVHLVRFLNAQRAGHHNNSPNAPGNVTLIPTANASLATHTFVLDPGHGVVYKDDARRCYEWFLSHRTARHVAHLLRSRHKVPAANITFMRTAGLGLIDPSHFKLAPAGAPLPNTAKNWPPDDAPEQGDKLYRYDMTARTVRIASAKLNLTHISDLLLTTHQPVPPFPRNPVPDGDRQQIITQNPTVIAACIARAMKGLAKRTAVANSDRWDTATQRYVFDTLPAGNPAGQRRTHNIPINASDRWVVTTASLRNLAERTARWSLLREGLGAGTFQRAARDAMLANNALQYMADACFREADRPPGDPFLAHGIKGWAFRQRRRNIAAMRPAPDITLTLHHNAVDPGKDAQGIIMLASATTNATEARMRLQKTCLKYVTGLGAGLHGGGRGITQNHDSAMNGAQFANVISGYAFFEVEFMNAPSGPNPQPFEYERHGHGCVHRAPGGRNGRSHRGVPRAPPAQRRVRSRGSRREDAGRHCALVTRARGLSAGTLPARLRTKA